MKPYKWCRYCDKIKSECKCARPSIVLCENDHLEAVKQARYDALRWVLEQLTYNWVYGLVCTRSAEELRDIIEKELSK